MLDNRLRWPTLPVALLYLLNASLFTAVYLQSTDEFARATLADLTRFEAEIPFQHRMLLPAIVAGISVIAPVLSLEAVYAALCLGAVLGLILALRELCRSVLSPQLADVGPLLVLYPLLWNLCVLNRHYLPYDVPASLIFCTGLIGLLRGPIWLLWASLALGALNRETILFLTLCYAAVSYGSTSLARIAATCTLQLALVTSIKLTIAAILPGGGSSGLFELHLLTNAEALTRISPASIRTSLVFGGLWLLVPLAWGSLPPQVRRLLWVIPPFLASIGLFGVPWETRIYNELIPIVTLASLGAFRSPSVRTLTRTPGLSPAQVISGVRPEHEPGLKSATPSPLPLLPRLGKPTRR